MLGVTLSEEQHKVATDRAARAGLSDRVRIELKDYRQVTGQFDRIVSIGMFEHVGLPHYAEYFQTVHDRLKPDGVALIHSIGRVAPPSATSPWIAKLHLPPVAMCPRCRKWRGAVERSHLYPTDLEIWRLHYAETLRHWHARFTENEDRARALYDDAVLPDVALLSQGRPNTPSATIGNACSRSRWARRQDAVPLTRDYLYPAEAHDQMRAAE